ncbi:hypothetical protein NLM33_31645 [Bradyrhizobium sp. CCGUVB1N3]|uniref:hypothetical protein n=1 Tax=Bradyrhizobium sp. CCGUVB1N3 TaxID=2949629 RepID=UPI0020B38E84|nr:hypothetical protein [Bradyrhizobium sp. CCGUVB1N3]MCP3474876.1 hypothetical protein [Bradyrhizobium sp. CCGUVB1N3]
MKTSRRVLLAGMAGLVAAPQAASNAFASTADAVDMTVAEERFARLIAAAHAPDITRARHAERYAETHWREYVAAARAVLSARG